MRINFTAPLMTLLFCVLVVLKLLNMITISWWWVFAPLWGSAAIGLGILLLLVIGIVFFSFTAEAATRLWKKITGKKS